MEVSSDTTQADSTGSVEESAGVLACRTEVWAPLLEGLAIDSTAVDIGQDFVDYLNEDGLDGGALPMPRRDSDDSDSDWEYDDSPRPDSYPASSTLAERFPVLNARVEEVIGGFGGFAFPKLSWSAPTDAEWLRGPDGMKCRNLDEIAVLLKASDFAQFDLQRLALPEGQRQIAPLPKLILKPYLEPFHETLEFRCFVRNRKLRGVCPRHLTGHLPFLQEMMFGEDQGLAKLRGFIENQVMIRLAREDYDRIVIDVYKRKDRYLVVDLGPWDEELTDSLLFTWEELQQQEGGDEVEWREVPRGSMPTNPSAVRKQASRMPVEVAQQLLLHGGDVEKLVDSLR
ncbi:hypothetical protein FOZ63_000172 [Perkinsus olseni]|uniref:Cell division cycle protein 123 n=1 Tax=Perkinsus olseni TaxID=32597 RepID=A0A7J6U2V0_PEROL|nr:hypothetical protein FOZ63_000172 [Perkinsus olseni]KAF4751147.1 hypothetical protein FOZ62_023209 [Perkinsus olseni]